MVDTLEKLEIVNEFAKNLVRLHSRSELIWYVVEDIIRKLDFEDCVVYRYDEARQCLRQEAAFGEKQNDGSRTVNDPIAIPLGKGITGYVAQTLRSEIVADTTKDPRYIVDLRNMRSEITVPIKLGKKLYAVIDCESSEVGFFDETHLEFLETIATMLASRLAQWDAFTAAERANEQKTRFLMNLSHEVRTPLNAIIGYSELMSQDALKTGISDQYKDYAESITGAGNLLLDLINDVLELSAIEAGEFRIQKSKCIIGTILSNSVSIVAPRADAKSITVSTDIAAPEQEIYCDKRAITQVLINLLSNAVKYSHSDTVISVTSYQCDGCHCIKVIDQGVGIPQEKLGTVTEWFDRGNIDAYEPKEGIGVGLSIAKALVELHGGSIQIRSQVHVGTEVEVRIPQGEDQDAERMVCA